MINEHLGLAPIDLTPFQGGEHQRQLPHQHRPERQLPLGSGGGPGQSGGDLVRRPLELLRGPRHRDRATIGRQLGDRHRAGDLGQPGEQARLVVRQLPGSGLQHLHQSGVRDLIPPQTGQGGGQLRARW
jgi:hypothetical protein